MCHVIAATISTIIPRALVIETMKSLGGVFFISVTAFLATSRGCTLGFSGGALLKTVACTASTCAGLSSGRGGGGATYTSLRGGNSSISEKLRLALAPACRFSSIMGSTCIAGASYSGSTVAAVDIVADGPEGALMENVSGKASPE